MSQARAVQRAYDGSTAVFKSLTAWGWGELINLGFFRVHELWRVLFGMDHFQRALASRSVALLDPQPGDVVLDVACGRGWASDLIAAHGARAIGVDLLQDNIDRARARFGGRAGIEFIAGDARDLRAAAEKAGLGPGSVDRIHCLEAGFYFGPDGRVRFLRDAFELLREGGRLVLVDFTWKTDHPEEIEELDPDGLVRDTWQFEQFEPLERYRGLARGLGFTEERMLDWSTPVIGRFLALCGLLVALARFRPIRAFFKRLRPGLAGLSPEEWDDVGRAVRAHAPVRRRTRYVAMVFERP
jgi:cyclopropane fatty-acyl-phospholipid synthase-like methyltransferase